MFRLFEMVEYESVLFLDTDLVVLHSLDHLFDRMLQQPQLQQLGATIACKSCRQKSALNTGVWMCAPPQRPAPCLSDAVTLASPPAESPCGRARSRSTAGHMP